MTNLLLVVSIVAIFVFAIIVYLRAWVNLVDGDGTSGLKALFVGGALVGLGIAVSLIRLAMLSEDVSFRSWVLSPVGLLLGGLLCMVTGIANVLYFFPTIIASEKSHPNTAAIFWLNLFLGWSVVAWVVAQVWATSEADCDTAARWINVLTCGTAIGLAVLGIGYGLIRLEAPQRLMSPSTFAAKPNAAQAPNTAQAPGDRQLAKERTANRLSVEERALQHRRTVLQSDLRKAEKEAARIVEEIAKNDRDKARAHHTDVVELLKYGYVLASSKIEADRRLQELEQQISKIDEELTLLYEKLKDAL